MEESKVVLECILFFDLQDATFCTIYSDYSFDVHFRLKAFIKNKQRQGGQSSQRFERNRENEINYWFKKIIENLPTNKVFVVACQDYYYPRFYEKLPEVIKKNVSSKIVSEFYDESGIYQRINHYKTS
jgi:peptide subunit release factor 1 (eRF1)